jgi:hypothetical protein
MRIALQILSALGIAGTVLPAFLFFTGTLELGQVHWIMLVAAVVWFGATPFWMERKQGA